MTHEIVQNDDMVSSINGSQNGKRSSFISNISDKAVTIFSDKYARRHSRKRSSVKPVRQKFVNWDIEKVNEYMINKNIADGKKSSIKTLGNVENINRIARKSKDLSNKNKVNMITKIL